MQEKRKSSGLGDGEELSKKVQKARAQKYKELEDRLIRERKLKRSQEGMALTKSLMVCHFVGIIYEMP